MNEKHTSSVLPLNRLFYFVLFSNYRYINDFVIYVYVDGAE